MRLTLVLSFAVLLFDPSLAFAFRNQDMSGDDSGAVAVYTFDEIGGTVAHDTSGVGTPLDLTMSTAGNLPTADGTAIRTNALFQGGALIINPKPNGAESGSPDQGYQSAQRQRTFLVSAGAADKLNACTSGFTIQAFVRPWFPFQGSSFGNMIVGLSNSENLAAVKAANFGLYQSGMAGAEAAMLSVRTGTTTSFPVTSATGDFSSVRQLDNPGQLTELIATQESTGVLTVYVNRIGVSSLTAPVPNFSATAKLVIGNELVPLTANADGTANVSQQENWSGEIHHMAIYCRGFSRTEILGTILGNKIKADIVAPQAGAISNARSEARRLVERLSGQILPIDHPMILRVEQKLQQGDRLGAAKIITGDLASNEPGYPEFLNTIVKQFALKMSTREETIRTPFNDFAASFMGVTRDEASAQDLLTKDFYYMGDPAKTKVRSDLFKDILVSNNHYADLEQNKWDIGKVLMRVSGQQIAMSPTGDYTASPDPAGVLTSRAFMGAHAIAGTNRRMVEFTFRSFMCIPMVEMADISASGARIGRDVDRTPGGDATKFETTCKGCHTQMDGFRAAFAHYDFQSLTFNGSAYAFIRNTEVSGSGTFGFANDEVDGNGTVYKMNHNETVFPNGYTIIDNSFVNNANGPANGPIFGWKGVNKLGGVGAGQFGRLIADSDRFAQCMAKRAFEIVCTPGAPWSSTVTDTEKALAETFKTSGYKLRSLFQQVAINPACAAGMGK